MTVYYNDHDPFACDVLAELMADGLIAQGDIDSRSITEVEPSDVQGYTRCHFFAGLGGWDYALKLAGWPDDAPVWTGSCPCQPFSSAGKRRGIYDERHLWPDLFRLIAECCPPVVVGEQVASRAGCEWLAGVRADLDGAGYAVGAADLCAASVGAPHIRQRLYWVADAERRPAERYRHSVEGSSVSLSTGPRQQRIWSDAGHGGVDTGRLGDSDGPRSSQQPGRRQQCSRPAEAVWDGSTAVRCIEPTRDGGTVEKWRRAPTEPALQPLAHGIPNRVGTLRLAGNAIVPQVAAAFVRAYLDSRRAT